MKVAVLGSGLGGCITALHYYFHGRDHIDEIEIIHDSSTPIQPVGQGTTPDITELVFETLNNHRYPKKNNFLNTTIKIGVEYENWSKENLFHHLSLTNTACHYDPAELSQAVLRSGLFKVNDKVIKQAEEEVDADIIFDCRGRELNDDHKYQTLTNPINSVLLGKKAGHDPSLLWTKCVATPDGWCFVIPNIDSTSYGYLYNNSITESDMAKSNFKELFDVESSNQLHFKNYLAKSIWTGERTILNGNKFAFIEPLEATSGALYRSVCQYAWDVIFKDSRKRYCNENVRRITKEVETFILWHYANGSQYQTPFWDYAKQLWLEHKPFGRFNKFLDRLNHKDRIDIFKIKESYGQWGTYSFYQWSRLFNK